MTMSDTLRIMVRTEEVREVGIEIRCLVHASNNTFLMGTLRGDAQLKLKELGYVPDSLEWDGEECEWYAKFRTLRDATYDEVNAWHYQELSKTPVHCLVCETYKYNIAHQGRFLEGKEIVLEVVKDGDA